MFTLIPTSVVKLMSKKRIVNMSMFIVIVSHFFLSNGLIDRADTSDEDEEYEGDNNEK